MNREIINQIAISGLTTVIVATIILVLFRLRFRFGLTPLFVTLGVFQPIQVLLASSIYSEILPGVVVSPGSIIMFSASLFAILLVYIREDTLETRKIIYGIVIANLTMTLLMATFSLQLKLPSTMNFLNLSSELFNVNARITVAGTVSLFVDVLLIIFVYELIWRLVTKKQLFCVFLTMALILSLDTIVFATGAFWGQENYWSILRSGLIGKVVMAIPFSLIITAYLYWGEPTERKTNTFEDIFNTLSYRQKYEIARQKGQQTELQLHESAQYNRTLFNESPVGLVLCRMDGSMVDVNTAYADMIGRTVEETLQLSYWQITPEEFHEQEQEILKLLEATGRYGPYSKKYVHKDGHQVSVLLNGLIVEMNGENFIWSSVEDVTEREKLQEQLVQASKMEAIGNLAGGVAHDYNNMLSIIIGYGEMASEEIKADDPLHGYLEEILAAAQRSRDITRQLLAFARKQTIEPKILDLNKAVESALKMLQRLLGENIDLVWLPKQGLWPVEIDPSQLDQILANLCVNARDAIADIGKMTIETDMVSLDQAYCEDHLGFIPGDFVVLAVSDNGCGMDKETLDLVFEPFFTTKQVGQGTGLGLATVYGIVRQSNGFINAYSELGSGTTFKIYLPSKTDLTETVQPAGTLDLVTGHGETILLVEDEASILKLVKRMLADLGYRVLATSSPLEAIDLAQKHPEQIALLVTDVVLPEMNGRDLAARMQNDQPELKCLYMSGYTANVIAHHGVLDKDIQFIDKPFSKKDFGHKIARILADSTCS